MAQSLIYPPISAQASNITAPFDIKNGIGVLRIDGWKDGDKLHFETMVGNECDDNWIPVIFCCSHVSTSAPSTHMVFPIPGRYRAVLSNVDDLHIDDDTYFEDVKIYFDEYVVRHDLSSYFQLCC